MDQETLFKLLQTFDESTVREMDLDFDGAHVYLSKNETSAPVAPSLPGPVAANAAPAATAPAKAGGAGKPAAKVPDKRSVIKAQLVGVVYLQPAPDKNNYVHVGDHIQKGQIVCVIEAMKMLTEVKSEFNGTVVSIDVHNEDMVDFDQPLMTVQPD
ncbi:MAG: acetyl-CoA carboxylase, biotin carboxyl carrier protein [Lactobacillus sp.]|jgi:acetyl-CoA carboxylase biotin carboxyl carrier protein|nr:acetyl-CoA carboxylase, biotin carboxyl carrier protein [Lactobacillus sp.]